MKLGILLTLSFAILTGCEAKDTKQEGKSENKEEKQQCELVNFKEEDGLYTCLDTEKSPFDESGLDISIKKGENGYAKFVITDKEGKATVDYFDFNYEKNQVERYRYVSAMGSAYYYYFDLEKGELEKIENGDHEDTTEKTKSGGRWDKAANTVKDDVQALEDYFKQEYGKTIKEAVTEK